MPIYEYGCDICEALVERIESIKDAETPPECCNAPMRKLISASQLHRLKGTGFYATEWGNQQHHLQPRDQAIRAARECKERDLHPNRPRPHNDNDRRKFDKDFGRIAS